MAHRTCDCRHYPYDCWSCLEECSIKSKEPEHTLVDTKGDKDHKFNKQSELKDYETY